MQPAPMRLEIMAEQRTSDDGSTGPPGPASATRRAALIGAAAGITLLPLQSLHADDVPRRGGLLRLGLGGGSSTDSLNPLLANDSVMISVLFGLYNGLVENSADNRPVPELAESFTPEPGARAWTFALRRDVRFQNGKMFDAEDAIYSLNLHRGDTRSGAAGPMRAVTEIVKLDAHAIRITLAVADADFPSVLTDYHILMVPNGFSDWDKPVGTGAYALDSFKPGSRILLKKASAAYWKPDRGLLDAVDITVLNDTSTRMNALILGQVDAINRADPRTVSRIKKSPVLDIVRAAGGWFPIMAMQVDADPYTNLDLRQALKYVVDREQMIKTLFSGYGSLGNDHPIPRSDPNFNTDLEQLAYDPDRAKFHFRRAAAADPRIVLQTSEAAFNGAVDMARLFQASAARSGIAVNIQKEPTDGYFDKVWLKGPFVASYWAGRPAATQMLDVAYKRGAPWNETHWSDTRFETMLAAAQADTDEAKRKAVIWDMQAMLRDASGSLIPCFRDWLDAHHQRVGGHTPHSGFDMDNGRIAEKAFLRE
jgi:peptide/nickel transport system substrate-binding protein